MIYSTRRNIKQIIIGLLICVAASAVLFFTFNVQAQVTVPDDLIATEAEGFAWELNVLPQDDGTVIAERDMWLVNGSGEMIDGTKATFTRDCNLNGDVAASDDGIDLSGGNVTCNLPGSHMRSYNHGGDGWPGIDNLWGITICKYSSCDISDEFLDSFAIRITATANDNTIGSGNLLHYTPFNRTKNVVTLNTTHWAWAERVGNVYIMNPKSLVTPGTELIFTTWCTDPFTCNFASGEGIASLDYWSPTQTNRHNMYGVLYLGANTNQLGQFQGEVESLKIQGVSCEACYE